MLKNAIASVDGDLRLFFPDKKIAVETDSKLTEPSATEPVVGDLSELIKAALSDFSESFPGALHRDYAQVRKFAAERRNEFFAYPFVEYKKRSRKTT